MNSQKETDAPSQELFWADTIAREIIARAENTPVLKEIVKKHGYIIYDEKTPSGKIHIGSGRGWIIHDSVAKALRDYGVKARFILSSDDIDPFDKMNADLPKEYEKYLGMPFRNIPSPVKGYDSYAQYYFMQCVEKFEEFGIEADIESTGKLYDTGQFNETIKTALNSIPAIKKIYEEVSKKDYDKFPFNPRCEKCGKIGTTRGYAWDSAREVVKYRCEPNYVNWAAGCGYEGEISPYNGNGKFPWKVEWAAKWPTKKVVYEVAGKDHFTKGGSRDVAIRISDIVFHYPPPLPSEVIMQGKKKIYAPGKAYEFFNIGGKKMSTSKGQGIGFADVNEVLPAHMLRYLLIRSRPHAVVDFDPFNRNDLILLYDRYDKTERIYFDAETVDVHEREQNKRIYQLSHVGKIPQKLPVQISLTYASAVIQIGKTIDGALTLLKKSGHVPDTISEIDHQHITARLMDAKRWVENFAPDEYKFVVSEKVSDAVKNNLRDTQKNALHTLADALESKKWTEAELHAEFWKICEQHSIKPQEFFEACYHVLINKPRGPKLAAFILSIGAKQVSALFREV